MSINTTRPPETLDAKSKVAARLADALKESGLSQSELARQLAGPLANQVHVESVRRLVGKWLNGRNKPGSDYAVLLAEIFDKPYGYFSMNGHRPSETTSAQEADALELARQAARHVRDVRVEPLDLPLGRDAIANLVPAFNASAILLDEVVELVPGERVVALQTFSDEAWPDLYWFKGSNMVPGIMLIEALAQAGALSMLALPGNRHRLALCAGFNEGRFRRIVQAGETLRIETVITAVRDPIAHAAASATVDGELAVHAELIFAIT